MLKTIGLCLVLYGLALIGQQTAHAVLVSTPAVRAQPVVTPALPGLPPFDCEGCPPAASTVAAAPALPGLPPFDCEGCCEYNDSCAPGCNNQGCKAVPAPARKRFYIVTLDYSAAVYPAPVLMPRAVLWREGRK